MFQFRFILLWALRVSVVCFVQTPVWCIVLTRTRMYGGKTTKQIALLQPYPVVTADALLEIGTAVISAVLSLDEHLSQTNTSCVPKFCYQSVYCCFIRHFLVRIRIAKCFTNSSKRFRCEVMLENEHTFCLWKHHVRTCTAFEQLAWAAA
jgi:hypothetical protein